MNNSFFGSVLVPCTSVHEYGACLNTDKIRASAFLCVLMWISYSGWIMPDVFMQIMPTVFIHCYFSV